MKLAVVLVLALARGALADRIVLGYPGVTDLAGPLPDPALHVELGAAGIAGYVSAGQPGGLAGGGSVTGGVRKGRFAVIAELSALEIAVFDARPFVASVGHPSAPPAPPGHGGLVREAIDARWSVVQARSLAGRKHGPYDRVVRDELWLSAGVGHERIRWSDHVAGLDRRDIAFGIGFDSRYRLVGSENAFTLGVRVVLAPDPMAGIDRSVLASFALQLGN